MPSIFRVMAVLQGFEVGQQDSHISGNIEIFRSGIGIFPVFRVILFRY